MYHFLLLMQNNFVTADTLLPAGIYYYIFAHSFLISILVVEQLSDASIWFWFLDCLFDYWTYWHVTSGDAIIDLPIIDSQI